MAIPLQDKEIEVLITSLNDRAALPLSDIGRLYFLRWNIEECYKRLKISTELENFSGVNLEAVLQEFWAHLLMCNVLALEMHDFQDVLDPDNLPEYRLNFSVLFGVMREKIADFLIGKGNCRKVRKFFMRAASRAKVRIRPGRSYSRKNVGKPRRGLLFRRVC